MKRCLPTKTRQWQGAFILSAAVAAKELPSAGASPYMQASRFVRWNRLARFELRAAIIDTPPLVLGTLAGAAAWRHTQRRSNPDRNLIALAEDCLMLRR
jgi:hypothetical protein